MLPVMHHGQGSRPDNIRAEGFLQATDTNPAVHHEVEAVGGDEEDCRSLAFHGPRRRDAVTGPEPNVRDDELRSLPTEGSDGLVCGIRDADEAEPGVRQFISQDRCGQLQSIALIVNELVVNSLKHAFEDGDSGVSRWRRRGFFVGSGRVTSTANSLATASERALAGCAGKSIRLCMRLVHIQQKNSFFQLLNGAMRR
jgi:hypothetical protein